MPSDPAAPTTRRSVLAVAGTTLSALATGRSVAESDRQTRPDWERPPPTDAGWHVRPGHAPFSIPAEPPCADRGTTDLPAVAWGAVADWELRVDRVRAGRGDTLRVRLRNASGERRKRLSDAYWHLETYTAEGWHDGSGTPGRVDLLVGVDPGEVHEWRVDLTPEGLFGHGCTDLPAGRYRFVYTGLRETDTPLAVGFDLLDGGWLLTGTVASADR